MKILVYPTLAAGLILAACSSQKPSPDVKTERVEQEAAEMKLCQNMNNLEAAVREYPVITPVTSMQEITAANEKVDMAVKEVREAAKDVTNPRVDEVEAARARLKQDVETIYQQGGTTEAGTNAEILEADARNLREAWDRLYNSMECGV